MSTGFVSVCLNTQLRTVPVGVTVAAALTLHQIDWGRRSVTGEPRAALCGMGVCFECRVTINGTAQQRACQILVCEDMQVVTDV
jgi:D-hydroxyproline dehydrogenase subunit gamma